jgi:hypothetical protein
MLKSTDKKESQMPVTKDNLLSTMSYHPLSDAQKDAYNKIEDAAVAFAMVLLEVMVPCGDQQAAIRHIFEAKATANRGIAVNFIV